MTDPSAPDLLPDPRPHHYVYAHRMLHGVCAQDPLKFFALLASDERGAFLEWLHGAVCRSLDDAGEPDFGPGDVRVETVRVGGHPTAIFVMPPPRAIAEAFFVAMVLTDRGTDVAPPSFRCFTLELGEGMDGTLRTVLGEWTDDAHHNYGDGPDPRLPAFGEAIEAQLEPVARA
jgi:hypothetical protein